MTGSSNATDAVRRPGRDRRPPEPRARASRLIPAFFALLVVFLGGTLLAIGARSPYTHGNLMPDVDPRYTRTEQISVGPSQPYEGGQVGASVAKADAVTRGAAYFVTKGCAGCHGLRGTGGVVGPDMAGQDASYLREFTREGRTAMPAYAEGALTDEQLGDIVTYLRAASTQ